jgi:hypothetical protein
MNARILAFVNSVLNYRLPISVMFLIPGCPSRYVYQKDYFRIEAG